MRLAVVLSSLIGGGMERMRLHLIEQWLQQGIEVDLVLGRFSGPLCQEVPKDVQIFEVSRRSPILFPLGLRSYIKERQPTHILSAGSDINAITLLVLKYTGNSAPVTISINDHLSSKLEIARGLERIKIHVVLQVLRRNIQVCHSVIAVSKGVASDLKYRLQIRDDQLHVVYNPVITSDTLQRLEAPLGKCPVPAGMPWIVYAGRFKRQKALDVLIDAFHRLSKHTIAHLVLLGDGPLRPDITASISKHGLQDRIHMMGFQNNPLPWIRQANVLALSSRHEGLGNVLIEALACGTQIVSTDCPSGPSEILDDGRYGQLVPVDDAEALAQALLRSLDGSFHIDEKVLRERAALFSAERAASQYMEIITAFASQASQ